MLEALALALAQAAPDETAAAESRAVVQVFRDACTNGELKLSRDRGRLVKEKDLPDYADVLQSWFKWTNKTFVELKYPSSTHVILGDLANPQPKSLARRCLVISRRITQRDAVYALIESTPDAQPRQTWIPAMHLAEWVIDRPKDGFPKRLAIRPDGTVYLEVGTYTSALN